MACWCIFSPSPLTMQHQWVLMTCWWLFHLSLNHTDHNKHQRVVATCWLLFLPLPQPCWLQWAPASLKDSLVPFLFLTWPCQPQWAPTSHNNSLDAFFWPYLDHARHNKHQWVLRTCWCHLPFYLDHAGHSKCQRVIMTCWLLFFNFTLTMPAMTTTSES